MATHDDALQTRLLHAGSPRFEDGVAPVNVPVVRTSTVRFEGDAVRASLHHRREAGESVSLYGRHGMTTHRALEAAIGELEGAELNRIYRRTDDGRDPERATLELLHEVVVRPGVPIAFLPDDIHSIHVGGAEPTLHFHLYGRPLETLTGRLGFETDTGVVVRYNAKHMQQATQAVG